LSATTPPIVDSPTCAAQLFARPGPAVPEPSTWAMILLGFAALGFLGYRRALRVA
jgi:PEP-CTERM motif